MRKALQFTMRIYLGSERMRAKKVGQKIVNFVMYFALGVIVLHVFLWALADLLELFIKILELFV
jgi:hypothetical protein